MVISKSVMRRQKIQEEARIKKQKEERPMTIILTYIPPGVTSQPAGYGHVVITSRGTSRPEVRFYDELACASRRRLFRWLSGQAIKEVWAIGNAVEWEIEKKV